jgi:hypothetical protein
MAAKSNVALLTSFERRRPLLLNPRRDPTIQHKRCSESFPQGECFGFTPFGAWNTVSTEVEVTHCQDPSPWISITHDGSEEQRCASNKFWKTPIPFVESKERSNDTTQVMLWKLPAAWVGIGCSNHRVRLSENRRLPTLLIFAHSWSLLLKLAQSPKFITRICSKLLNHQITRKLTERAGAQPRACGRPRALKNAKPNQLGKFKNDHW